MRRLAAFGTALALLGTVAGCASQHQRSATASAPATTTATATTTTPSSAAACAGTAGSSTSHTMNVASHPRTFIEHLPSNFAASTKYVAIIVFPGRGESAVQIEGYSQLDSTNTIVLYAQGLDGTDGESTWEATPYAGASAHDYEFASDMVNWLAGAPCVDANRIGLTGKSDGAGFAASAACVTSGVAAVATVSGAFYQADTRCTPTGRPLPVMNMHGAEDPVIPYNGSTTRGLYSTNAWLALWQQRDSCTGSSTNTPVGADVVRSTLTSCTDGTEVVNYDIADGGHTWPGATVTSGPGGTTHTIDAAQLIAAFFTDSQSLSARFR
ncbi:alpha/beta hydrolase family esterase [Catenulispora pinisilvae]|uniref:alpha/beta hydrolase family esterase n=1 Tax=Catenulispora pinisilvae TaxID=2705253 RepID=UPI001890B9C0|nr:acyl-CoA thioester hydrolase/BAAT C-terminal domain-containing protein [Catenulispora pinisilvae]